MQNVIGILGLAVLSASLIFGASMAAETKQQQALPNPQIDYAGFAKLTNRLQSVREKHRVPVDVFVEMAKDKNTMILDTRSKKAFDDVHVQGAVHLNFSDFTDQKLAQVIPSKKTRILIYCNNNFKAKKIEALLDKRAPLALNVPTFVNLHGYGYENVYELADVLELDEPRLKLTASPKIRAQFATK